MTAGSSEDRKRCLNARVSGKVQGVGFRYWVVMEASGLHLTGWVRNDPDGSVVIEAEGREADLRSMADALHRGPVMARVDSVEVRWPPYRGVYRRFIVEH